MLDCRFQKQVLSVINKFLDIHDSFSEEFHVRYGFLTSWYKNFVDILDIFIAKSNKFERIRRVDHEKLKFYFHLSEAVEKTNDCVCKLWQPLAARVSNLCNQSILAGFLIIYCIIFDNHTIGEKVLLVRNSDVREALLPPLKILLLGYLTDKRRTLQKYLRYKLIHINALYLQNKAQVRFLKEFRYLSLSMEMHELYQCTSTPNTHNCSQFDRHYAMIFAIQILNSIWVMMELAVGDERSGICYNMNKIR
ncbi:uncharacterized protein LOC115630734 [Scaptodrosophila lebanonensis]|uniref:Uncharacterized protein LOC115630734 n=1 Tax=Drosophila lebanonensis TaxID=7225 RepID=A0A6J2U4F2_DROLE|nr:uncharacterized protein LOC115630734 [Scaptodrosophila lebanonensis]